MANNKTDQNLNLQPQSIEAEQAVLGAMLSSKDAISKALQWVRSHHFYKESHSKIFLVMSDLFDKGEPIDTISVINKLKKNTDIYHQYPLSSNLYSNIKPKILLISYSCTYIIN